MVGKIIYGFVFVVLLPAILVLWAAFTEPTVRLTPIRSLPVGTALIIFGLFLVLSGMWAIYFFGKGLPMNAYPPARFVVEGVYAYLAHPIYVGFSILSFGVAIYTGSPSGLWLVAPCVVLGCVALVEGYEKGSDPSTLQWSNRSSALWSASS